MWVFGEVYVKLALVFARNLRCPESNRRHVNVARWEYNHHRTKGISYSNRECILQGGGRGGGEETTFSAHNFGFTPTCIAGARELCDLEGGLQDHTPYFDGLRQMHSSIKFTLLFFPFFSFPPRLYPFIRSFSFTALEIRRMGGQALPSSSLRSCRTPGSSSRLHQSNQSRLMAVSR